MKKLLKLLSYILVAAVASAATFFLTEEVPSVNSMKLAQLEAMLTEKFIGEVDETTLGDGAAMGMVAALDDRWSYYLSAAEYGDYLDRMDNSYVGVGITIQVAEDYSGFNILQVSAGGPAEEAGMLAGDKLVGVEGQNVAGWSTTDVSTLVKGEENTYVSLTVLREGEEQSYSVKRRTIKTPVATAVLLEGNIGLVTIKNFNTNCAKETIAAIESLIDQGATSLIFDVRNNGGGYANEMNKVLDYLLPKGQLFKTIDYTGKEEVTNSDSKCLEMPMAVLVNGSSYSAAEFFAAALWEYNWATVVGQQTSGKGYFQLVYTLSDGSAVGISVGKYVTPNGVSLEGVGITPDHVIEVDSKTAAAIKNGKLDPMEDPQILAAIEALKG